MGEIAMANELGPISLPETDTGLFLYIVLRNPSAQIWDNIGNNWVTFSSTDQNKYAIGVYVSGTKQTGSGALLVDRGTATWYGDKPTEITSTGTHYYEVWQKPNSGDTPSADTDLKIESGAFEL
jgi:hypothetical protein